MLFKLFIFVRWVSTVGVTQGEYRDLFISVYRKYSYRMSSKKILVTHCDVPQEAIDLLRQNNYELIINEELPYPSVEQIAAKAAGVDAIFWMSKLYLDKQIIDAAGPNLKVVGTMSAGINNIDLDLLKSRHVKLGNTPNVLNDAVAEVAVLLALSAAKRTTDGRKAIENGTWSFGPQWQLGQEIRGATIGIVGYGGIGQTIGKILQAFKISQILYTGHREKPEAKKYNAKFVTLDDLLSKSDFVFACVPLTKETTNMFDLTKFKTMKPTSIFVNISRGPVVQQEDLIQALKERIIFAAGLDVMTPEPLPTDHEFLKLDNCVLLPHIGSATFKTRGDMAMLTSQNIIKGLKGEPMIAPVF